MRPTASSDRSQRTHAFGSSDAQRTATTSSWRAGRAHLPLACTRACAGPRVREPSRARALGCRLLCRGEHRAGVARCRRILVVTRGLHGLDSLLACRAERDRAPDNNNMYMHMHMCMCTTASQVRPVNSCTRSSTRCERNSSSHLVGAVKETNFEKAIPCGLCPPFLASATPTARTRHPGSACSLHGAALLGPTRPALRVTGGAVVRGAARGHDLTHLR